MARSVFARVCAAIGAGAIIPLTFMGAAAAATKPSPLADLHYLVGPWGCTYRAGAVHVAYNATYAYDIGGRILREVTSWPGGGGADELLAYDPRRGGWTAIVLDDQGTSTVMRANGSDAKRIAYRSVYPDTSIAVAFNRISATEYTLNGRVRLGGKTITSVDTCLRGAR